MYDVVVRQLVIGGFLLQFEEEIHQCHEICDGVVDGVEGVFFAV